MNGRIIKFRMWDKLIKKMMPDLHTVSFDDPDYEFMQFTGLKDKNDVEIYEGDIVTYNLGNREYTWVDLVGWEDYGWVFIQFNPDEETSATPICNLPDLEVIGNIFENPELLK